jgi:hypothetical protein
MEKKTMIILSIVSIVFSVVYILLNYFGIIRYITLYMFPIQTYVKNYNNLDKIGKYKTVISLTGTPNQMTKLPYVIKSLLDQTVKVDNISISVPYGTDYKIPDNISDNISVYRCGPDQTILNCLIPSLLREGESTTKIITLGSDIIYGKDFIETLLELSDTYPDNIIYNNKIDDIDLNKGVVFSTNFFNEDFLNVPTKFGGNEWINNYFKNYKKNNIKYMENYNSL